MQPLSSSGAQHGTYRTWNSQPVSTAYSRVGQVGNCFPLPFSTHWWQMVPPWGLSFHCCRLPGAARVPNPTTAPTVSEILEIVTFFPPLTGKAVLSCPTKETVPSSLSPASGAGRQRRVQPHPAVRVLSSAETSTINSSGMGELAGFMPSCENIATLGYTFNNL